MIKSSLFFLLLLMGSCSSYSYKKIPVSSHAEALNVINNQMSFIREIFTQSREPYYGGLKWSQKCLDENKIGTLQEFTDYVKAESFLYIQNGEPGFCTGEQKFLVFVYCAGDDFVREATLTEAQNLKLNGRKICE